MKEPGGMIREIRKNSKVYRQLLAMDMATIEQRILGLEGSDLHKQAAAIIFDKPFTEVTAEERRVGKIINFGIIYGVQSGVSFETLLRKHVRPARKGGNDVSGV